LLSATSWLAVSGSLVVSGWLVISNKKLCNSLLFKMYIIPHYFQKPCTGITKHILRHCRASKTFKINHRKTVYISYLFWLKYRKCCKTSRATIIHTTMIK
jgi:hypothetical protein